MNLICPYCNTEMNACYLTSVTNIFFSQIKRELGNPPFYYLKNELPLNSRLEAFCYGGQVEAWYCDVCHQITFNLDEIKTDRK